METTQGAWHATSQFPLFGYRLINRDIYPCSCLHQSGLSILPTVQLCQCQAVGSQSSREAMTRSPSRSVEHVHIPCHQLFEWSCQWLVLRLLDLKFWSKLSAKQTSWSLAFPNSRRNKTTKNTQKWKNNLSSATKDMFDREFYEFDDLIDICMDASFRPRTQFVVSYVSRCFRSYSNRIFPQWPMALKPLRRCWGKFLRWTAKAA